MTIARQKFIEAMRNLCEARRAKGKPGDTLRQAITAFADTECGEPYITFPNYAHGGVNENGTHWTRLHEQCRDTLLEACGVSLDTMEESE